MKAIIVKKKWNNETLPKYLIVDKIEINDAKPISEKFNKFFINLGPNLANEIAQFDLTLYTELERGRINYFKVCVNIKLLF